MDLLDGEYGSVLKGEAIKTIQSILRLRDGERAGRNDEDLMKKLDERLSQLLMEKKDDVLPDLPKSTFPNFSHFLASAPGVSAE